MSIMTEKYGLFKYDTENDGLQKFNINLALNDNWDKVDTAMSTADAALKETKNAVDTLRDGLTSGSIVASRAANDSEGNNIISTYATKTESNKVLDDAKEYANGKHDTALAAVAAGDAETLSSAQTYADNAAQTVKNDLLNGAGDAYDTLQELATLIGENYDAIEALEIVATGKVDQTDFNNHVNNVSNPHLVTASQVGAPTVEEMNAAIAAIPTPDVSGQISTHNSDATAHPSILALINSLKPRITTVTLPTSGWSGSAAPFTQTVTINGILADSTKQVINVAPTATSANIEVISAAGVYATAQGENNITFSAMNSKPTANVSFIVQFQEAITI